MLKRVLFDYIRSFRWKNIVGSAKRIQGFASFYWIAYISILLPISNGMINKSEHSAAAYELGVLTFLFGSLGMLLFPLKLPKIMFLCPMNQEERTQYVTSVFWTRILVPTALQLLAGIILIMTGVLPVFVVAVSILATGAFLLTCSALFESERLYNFDKKEKNIRVIISIISVVINCSLWFIMPANIERLMGEVGIVHYIILIEMAILLLIDIYFLRKLPRYIELVTNYEERFDIVKSGKTNAA